MGPAAVRVQAALDAAVYTSVMSPPSLPCEQQPAGLMRWPGHKIAVLLKSDCHNELCSPVTTSACDSS
jgi:hypothetical protein